MDLNQYTRTITIISGRYVFPTSRHLVLNYCRHTGRGLLLLNMQLMFLGLLLLFNQSSAASQRCRFPQEWRGRYFQSGLGEIVIRESLITTKGTCIEQSRDYYLIDNRDGGCFHCLLLLRRHKNIIQYKESFCTTPASLKTVCAHIRVETPLYTIVREPAQPVRCPFQEAYYFNYNDLVHGSCERATSYAKPCASHTRYQLRFNHCVDTAAYNGRDVDMECLASWKDGSETYFYSRLSGPGFSAKDDRYRCFKYQHYGTEVSLAMSADATCRGLRSATDGPFLLEFTKDNSGWPPPSCNFPSWMHDVTWRDLSGQHRYSLGEDESTSTGYTTLYGYSNSTHRSSTTAHAQQGNHKQPQQQQQQHGSVAQYRCRHVVKIDENEYVIHAFVIHNCISKYQCLKLKRHANNAIELQQGAMVDHDSHGRCPTEDFKTAQLLTTADESALSSCPRAGVHHTAPSDGCLYRLNVGCTNESTVDIHHSCAAADAGMSLECVVSWTVPGTSPKTFVIVRRKNSDSLSCFSFRSTETSSVTFGEDLTCNRDVNSMSSGGGSSSITGAANPGTVGLSTDVYSIIRHENCKRETKVVTAIKKDPATPPTTTTRRAALTTTTLATGARKSKTTAADTSRRKTSIGASHREQRPPIVTEEDEDEQEEEDYAIMTRERDDYIDRSTRKSIYTSNDGGNSDTDNDEDEDEDDDDDESEASGDEIPARERDVRVTSSSSSSKNNHRAAASGAHRTTSSMMSGARNEHLMLRPPSGLGPSSGGGSTRGGGLDDISGSSVSGSGGGKRSMNHGQVTNSAQSLVLMVHSFSTSHLPQVAHQFSFCCYMLSLLPCCTTYICIQLLFFLPLLDCLMLSPM